MVDFEGQKLADKIMTYVMFTAGIVGFIAGYFVQSFMLTFKIFAGGFALAAVLTVPEWPYLNRNPLKWIPDEEFKPHIEKPTAQKMASIVKERARKK